MRILQIVPSISLVYGGPSQMVLGLSKALASQGVEVTVLTTDSNGDIGQPPLDVPLDKPVQQDGYQVRYFHCSPFQRYKFSLDLLRWLWIHSREFHLAHIHALFSPVSTAAATIARQRQLPYLLRPLGTLDPADLQKKWALKQLYGFLLERPNLAGAAGIHFTSQQEAKISERFGTLTKDIVIPLGVTPPKELPMGEARAKWKIPAQRPLLLFMSRIDPKKGLNLLIPALERLLCEGVDFHFVLAGANPQDPAYENLIREQIKNSPLSSNTAIAGFVDGNLKQTLLQEADLFVLPSYYENFGIAVAEAMVAATPVLISDQVHIWENVSDADAGWVCACEVDALTQCLQEALADNGEQKRRGSNARDYALRNYSWNAIAQRMIEAYQDVQAEVATN
ncbi:MULTISPECIES: hormogonium polysaccharide biosynthesis glycosyltransferase HpsP [unclassified Coleofasciculus]|uniref:hormogonium polysaccharide biosynthesis glycosyltransferase HpsP n=1 Tax=unclassified Coleofasciculus TaxID=2692782 RepID=UPI00187DECA1|nr:MULTISPECIES: hormogonium polysaccharide biosynthesis glycosyltransferase HpsP [unclassified Coleofasciculus]MBE9128807.1 glycosyltransferase [Coleofasciculus sp. LEGE 07081]MBE9149442.1 glycosyltransferase [Coleofasciculus sp. LEGE 07092]